MILPRIKACRGVSMIMDHRLARNSEILLQNYELHRDSVLQQSSKEHLKIKLRYNRRLKAWRNHCADDYAYMPSLRNVSGFDRNNPVVTPFVDKTQYLSSKYISSSSLSLGDSCLKWDSRRSPSVIPVTRKTASSTFGNTDLKPSILYTIFNKDDVESSSTRKVGSTPELQRESKRTFEISRTSRNGGLVESSPNTSSELSNVIILQL